MSKKRPEQTIDAKPDVRQQSLFDAGGIYAGASITPVAQCHIVDAGKRRDGKRRYWCIAHKADATAKYGKPAAKCLAADDPPLRADEIVELDLDKYRGGVALWGAVPAVYDTTELPVDRGIHIHARPKTDSKKEIDWTRRAVLLKGGNAPSGGVMLQDIDAIYYMITSVFGFAMSYVACTHCDWPHLDKDAFSVYPHKRHLCAGCGQNFNVSAKGIGNPIIGLRELCKVNKHKIVRSKDTLSIRQADYPGGIQIWGSNPAFLWTANKPEAEGIHVHAYRDGSDEPVVDETYGKVTIDGVRLSPEMVRFQMAQNVMPSLTDRVRSIQCSTCGESQFDRGAAAYTPVMSRTCHDCGHEFVPKGRRRKLVANPLSAILEKIVKFAPRPAQRHRLGLRTETL